MAELKPAYLIHGDDHGAIAERRAGLRALVEAEGGGGGNVELLDGEAASPAGVARALAAMTLSMAGSSRVILVEGVERWRDADVEKDLLPAIAAIAPETTLALFAREDARAKAPAALAKAVRGAGGQVVSQMNVKPRELAPWVAEQAARLGLALDRGAAQMLVDVVGERQQRLLRELEKLALLLGDGDGDGTATGKGAAALRRVEPEEILASASHSAESQVWSLADALVAGDARQATFAYMRLRGQGERLSGLSYLMAQRLRDGLMIALRLAAGESPAAAGRGLRIHPWAAQRLAAALAGADSGRLRAGLVELAELELLSRGGAAVVARRPGELRAAAALQEDTLALRAIEAMTG